MTEKTKNILKNLMSGSSWFFFGLAIFMIYRQLSSHSFSQIVEAVSSLSFFTLGLAMIFSLFGYVVLSTYDYLALKYISRTLPFMQWVCVGFIGFSISNNAGHAVVSGGSVRYKWYTHFGLTGTEVLKMIIFSGFTYLVACFAIAIIGFVILPDSFFEKSHTSEAVMLAIFFASIIGLIVYFSLSIFCKKPIIIKKVKFKIPDFKLALMQVVLGSFDILFAALVLYVALISFTDVSFKIFLGVFMVSQVIGVFSQVPGGIGVFEGVFLSIMPEDADSSKIFAAMIVYRICYYLIPLVISAIIIFFLEKKILKEKKLKPKILRAGT